MAIVLHVNRLSAKKNDHLVKGGHFLLVIVGEYLRIYHFNEYCFYAYYFINATASMSSSISVQPLAQ